MLSSPNKKAKSGQPVISNPSERQKGTNKVQTLLNTNSMEMDNEQKKQIAASIRNQYLAQNGKNEIEFRSPDLVHKEPFMGT